jgi:hypothetical protein
MTPNSMPPVDLAVIRWFLSLTIAEQLDYLEESIAFATDVCRSNGLDPWAEAAGLGRRNIETIAVPRLAASWAMAHGGRP